MSSPTRSNNTQLRNHTTPRMTRRGDLLTSSIEFTPAKDVSARMSSFKRLSASGTRCIKPSDVSSVLSQSRASHSDFKVFVDIPFDGGDSLPRGKSPSTPKRSRPDFGAPDEFDDISPIGFAEKCDFGSPRTTPKRRKSLDRRASSLTDLFSALREEDQSKTHRSASSNLPLHLSKSVDFSIKAASPPRYFTPPRKEARVVVTPMAPRKSRSRRMSLMSSEDEDSLAKPRRLFTNDQSAIMTPPAASARPIRTTRLLSPSPPSSAVDHAVDYSGVMSIVGFVASFIARTDGTVVAISELVELITSVSLNHRTVPSATRIVLALVKVVPQWVTLQPDKTSLAFNRELKTFDVLTKLRILKRAQNQLETQQSQEKWFQ